MNSAPGITFAIPTYNRCQEVMALVKALVPQLGTHDEILVVDDGSRDDTASRLREVDRARVIRFEANRGMVRAWNTGLVEARCEWICMVHDDDLVSNRAAGMFRRACEAASGPALIGHAFRGPGSGQVFGFETLEPGSPALLRTNLCPSGVMIHRSIVESLGGFDERYKYSPDLEYFPRVWAQYKVILITSPQVVRHREHDHNYRYATWVEPDFIEQLEDIENKVATYAGLTGEQARERVGSQMATHAIYMLRQARRLRDRKLVRKVGAIMRAAPWADRRLRLVGSMAVLTGWAPTHSPLPRR